MHALERACQNEMRSVAHLWPSGVSFVTSAAVFQPERETDNQPPGASSFLSSALFLTAEEAWTKEPGTLGNSMQHVCCHHRCPAGIRSLRNHARIVHDIVQQHSRAAPDLRPTREIAYNNAADTQAQLGHSALVTSWRQPRGWSGLAHDRQLGLLS